MIVTDEEQGGPAGLAGAMVKMAIADVKTWCLRRTIFTYRGTKEGDRARSDDAAIKSMAWLCGIGRYTLPARFCCDALGADYAWLLEQTEEELAKLGLRGRFLLLKGKAISRYGVTGGAA